MSGETGRNGHTQTDDNSICSDRGGASVRVIIGDSEAKWIVIVLLAFGVAFAVVGERTDHDTARDAQTEAMILKSHVMEFQAKVDAWEKYGPPAKEKANAAAPIGR